MNIFFFNSKTIYSFLVLIFLLQSFCQAQYSNCTTCYGAKDQECAALCTKNFPNLDSGKFQKCKRTCVVNACNKECQYELKSGTNTTTPEIVNCDYCTRNSTPECTTKCNSLDNTEICFKNCISQTCKNSCTLPESTNKLYSTENAQSCESCKKTQGDPCKGKCGKGAGSYACAVACVERMCKDSCLID